MTRFRLRQSAVRFVDGDLEALALLFPMQPPTTVVRDIVHKFVRQERSKRGLPSQADPVPTPRVLDPSEASL